MNYISAKEFLEQSEKVQSELLEWWKPYLGGLFVDKFDYNNKIKCISMFVGSKFNGKIDKKDSIPLLQMHQLIQFIEDKTNKTIGIEINRDLNNVTIAIMDKTVRLFECDLLEALWKVAIEIADSHHKCIDEFTMSKEQYDYYNQTNKEYDYCKNNITNSEEVLR